MGFVSGETQVSYAVSGFGSKVDSPFALVLLGLGEASGEFLATDGRDLGLTFDSLSLLGIKKVLFHLITVGPDGSGQTNTLPVNLPAGAPFYIAAAGLDSTLQPTALTDAVPVVSSAP